MNEIRKYTITYLRTFDLQVNENLPLLDTGKEVRDLYEIGSRVCLLTCFKSLAEYPEDHEDIAKWIAQESLEPYLSGKERRILEHARLANQEMVDLSWYKESLYAMLWTVGIVADMNFPDRESDVARYARNLPPDVDMLSFRNSMALRPQLDILRLLDVYYNLHWISKRTTTPAGRLNKSVIVERRRALEWVCDNKLNWDEIDLST